MRLQDMRLQDMRLRDKPAMTQGFLPSLVERAGERRKRQLRIMNYELRVMNNFLNHEEHKVITKYTNIIDFVFLCANPLCPLWLEN